MRNDPSGTPSGTPSEVTLTKSCVSCQESLSTTLYAGVPMTERQAIDLGSWLTLISEVVQPDGIHVEGRQFCSFECLARYTDDKLAEENEAESKELLRMAAEKAKPYQEGMAETEFITAEEMAKWDSAYTEAYPPDVHRVILTDLE